MCTLLLRATIVWTINRFADLSVDKRGKKPESVLRSALRLLPLHSYSVSGLILLGRFLPNGARPMERRRSMAHWTERRSKTPTGVVLSPRFFLEAAGPETNKYGLCKTLLMITSADREKYVLKTKQDERILEKIKRLEKKKLTKTKKRLVKFCRSQLKDNWRDPMERFIDDMLVR